MILCTIRNTEVDLQDAVEIKETTNAELFLDKEILAESEKYFEIKPKVANWIKEKEDLYKPFEVVGKEMQIDPEELLRVFLYMIAREDRAGYKLLVDKKDKIKGKEDFIERFRKYQKHWTATRFTQNVISPDILKTALCHILYYTSNGRNTFDVPVNIIPYILNVDGVMPEGDPEGFDPNAPYEGDEYKEPEQKKFFKLFSFLKK